jgi:CheY-like chemotaxis protein
MNEKLRLLWIDDDTPKLSNAEIEGVEGVEVTSVQTCAEAERYLKRSPLPDYVVVDLVLPQGGWRGDRFFEMPGIPLTRQITAPSEDNPKPPKVVVFSIALTEDVENRARRAGAETVYDKMSISFPQLVNDMKRSSEGA